MGFWPAPPFFRLPPPMPLNASVTLSFRWPPPSSRALRTGPLPSETFLPAFSASFPKPGLLPSAMSFRLKAVGEAFELPVQEGPRGSLAHSPQVLAELVADLLELRVVAQGC
ncbi:hypothetical protein SALBM135S_06336 [Streptomyces alboniger]